jgi:hypothetical protein
MEVRYRWSFLIGDKPVTKFNTPPKPVMLEEIAEEQEHATLFSKSRLGKYTSPLNAM